MKAARIARIWFLVRSVAIASLGIVSENALVAAFALAVMATCFMWWSVFK